MQMQEPALLFRAGREERMIDRLLREYRVWDASTRVFHWLNFFTVLLLLFMGFMMLYRKELGITGNEARIALKQVHVLIGYVFVLNLSWRVVRGFVGNRFARWGSILPGRGYGDAVRDYVNSLRSGEPKQYLGHNPLGRAAVTLIMLLLLVLAVTGLIRAGTDIYYPPFGSIAAGYVAAEGVDPATIRPYDKTGVAEERYKALGSFKGPFGTLHIYTSYVLIFMILLHIVAVVRAEIVEGGGLVTAMINGKKVLSGKPEDLEE